MIATSSNFLYYHIDPTTGLFLTRGNQVEFVYQWQVKSGLPGQLQGKGLSQGDWVLGDWLKALWVGYDPELKQHILQVTIKDRAVFWEADQVRHVAIPAGNDEAQAPMFLRCVKTAEGHVIMEGFFPCRQGSSALTADADSPEWQEVDLSNDGGGLCHRYMAQTLEQCCKYPMKPYAMPNGSMPTRNGNGATQNPSQGMSVDSVGPPFGGLLETLFSRDDLCVARSHLLAAIANGLVATTDAAQLWGAVEAWAADNGKHWCGIGHFNDAVLCQIGKQLGMKLPQLVKRSEITSIAAGAGKASGCLLVVPVGTNHCIAVDFDTRLCWDPAAVETRKAIPMEGDWMQRILPGWNGWITECYALVAKVYATEVCGLCGAEVDRNMMASHCGSKACQKRQKQKEMSSAREAKKRKRELELTGECPVAKATKVA